MDRAVKVSNSPIYVLCQCTKIATEEGDGIDNDCDGVIDEEDRDGRDNDGDGLIDEDLKLVIGGRGAWGF